jgi:hypothetical protein
VSVVIRLDLNVCSGQASLDQLCDFLRTHARILPGL